MSWLSDTISSWIPNELKNNDVLKTVALGAAAYYGYNSLKGTDLGNTLATIGSTAKSQAVTAKGFLFGKPSSVIGTSGQVVVKSKPTKGLFGSYGFKDFGKGVLGNIESRAMDRLTQKGTQAEKLQASSAQIDPRVGISSTGARYTPGKTTVAGATDIRIQTALAQLVGSKNLAQILAGEIPANFVEPTGASGSTIKIGSSKLSDLEIT
jgi:hypothetical protein